MINYLWEVTFQGISKVYDTKVVTCNREYAQVIEAIEQNGIIREEIVISIKFIEEVLGLANEKDIKERLNKLSEQDMKESMEFRNHRSLNRIKKIDEQQYQHIESATNNLHTSILKQMHPIYTQSCGKSIEFPYGLFDESQYEIVRLKVLEDAYDRIADSTGKSREEIKRYVTLFVNFSESPSEAFDEKMEEDAKVSHDLNERLDHLIRKAELKKESDSTLTLTDGYRESIECGELELIRNVIGNLHKWAIHKMFSISVGKEEPISEFGCFGKTIEFTGMIDESKQEVVRFRILEGAYNKIADSLCKPRKEIEKYIKLQVCFS